LSRFLSDFALSYAFQYLMGVDVKKLCFLGFLIGLFFLNGCRTTDEGSETSAAGQVRPNPGGQSVIDPTGGCVATLYIYGFANSCSCPNGYNYNSTIGKCTLSNRMCTMAIVRMFHPDSGHCVSATNGCEASDLGSAGWRNLDTTDQCGVPTQGTVKIKAKVAGFDFKGFRIAAGLDQNAACPMVATPETDACLNLNGTTSFDKGCGVLCSLPIAPKNKVAGFDFKGLKISPALGQNSACPMVATAETDACINVGGSTTFDKGCKTLCSKPIAKKGKVAGFNFLGFKILDALPANGACPMVATAESDACLDAGGSVSYDKGCSIICSAPISQ
jgi:hypothetical protein